MAIIKCKMCGGTLEIAADQTVAVCEYCGTQQTLPKLSDDRRANLYDRANHFRRNNEFDKAMSIYEMILNEDGTDAEAYWSLVLCRYGIEYVEDPATHKRVPTINRAQFTSIFDDDNYKAAIAHADSYQRQVYEAEAHAINEIQKGILSISQKEEPFDVFICYKETDNNGRRTPDSVLANDLYHQLTAEGFKVFFSRITLEDKLGTAYEPYIFAALNSAKVMVVLGTRPEYFKAVWVRNEWSRYLALVKQSGGKKVLIPAYKDMDPYDLPDEFSHLQAQDMSKLGFMQDLIRGIKKLTQVEAPQTESQIIVERAVQSGGPNVQALLKRGNMALEDKEWNKAAEFFDQVLNMDAECGEAYLGKALAARKMCSLEALQGALMPVEDALSNAQELAAGERDAVTEERILSYAIPVYLERTELESGLSFSFQYLSWVAWREQELAKCLDWFNENRNMQRAEQYATPELKTRLTACKAAIRTAHEQALARAKAADAQQVAQIMENYAAHLGQAEEKAKELRAEAEASREVNYQVAVENMEAGEWQESLWTFSQLAKSEYKDSKERYEQCIQMRDAKAEADAREREAAAQERERQRLEEERQEQLRQQAAKKKKMTIAAIIAAVLVVI